MKDVNKTTRRLLDEGWTKDQTPPGMKPWNEFYGGWTYVPDTRLNVVFESPCGLLWKRKELSFSGFMSFMGVDWTEENDCMTVLCPYYERNEACQLNHPLLRDQRIAGCCREKLHFCAVHETSKEWDYEHSAQKVKDAAEAAKQAAWEAFKEACHGRVCPHQCWYNRNTQKWNRRYDPMRCLSNCGYCPVLGREMDKKRGNVYYDLRVTTRIEGDGLFPDEEKTSVYKGRKLFQKPKSLTICQMAAKCCFSDIRRKEEMRYHMESVLRGTKVEVINVRAERRESRDLMQDLRDVEDGIAVIHESDMQKASKEAKAQKRQEAVKRNKRKMEKLMLSKGWDQLGEYERHRVRKYLESEEIAALKAKANEPKAEQISLFEEE